MSIKLGAGARFLRSLHDNLEKTSRSVDSYITQHRPESKVRFYAVIAATVLNSQRVNSLGVLAEFAWNSTKRLGQRRTHPLIPSQEGSFCSDSPLERGLRGKAGRHACVFGCSPRKFLKTLVNF